MHSQRVAANPYPTGETSPIGEPPRRAKGGFGGSCAYFEVINISVWPLPPRGLHLLLVFSLAKETTSMSRRRTLETFLKALLGEAH